MPNQEILDQMDGVGSAGSNNGKRTVFDLDSAF